MVGSTGIRQVVFDREAALQRFGGDLDALRRNAAAFMADCPGRLAEIREAILQGNARALERAAYRLDWLLSTFSAGAAFDAAFRLEKMGREGNLCGAEAVYRRLEREIESLGLALESVGEEALWGDAAASA